MFHTKTDFVELNDEQLQNISGGLDVMAPEPGEPEEDDSWWLRMNGLPVY
jgi:bacteriocin-like protein|tara:strand:+ start:76 stop:225 length:150 start_codon:yes stop_codon:yes gene_type:complete